MLSLTLGQSAVTTIAVLSPQDKALINLLLIGAILGIGLLMVIGLIAAWRNHLQRQRRIEQDHEDREDDLPRPDAWATAAQRIDADDAGPDEAHVSSYQDEDQPDTYEPDADADEDGDDFPFRDPSDDDDDDDKGPAGWS